MSKTYRYNPNDGNDYYTTREKRKQAKKDKKFKRKIKKEIDKAERNE
jgi:hypothetical protein